MPFALSPVEVRVLGALVEKEAVTPGVYPMTLNGLLTACNQTSSRNPVMKVIELEATYATGSLKARGLLRHVHARENRVVKYRHVLDEAWELSPEELAVLAVLMLRGPQTIGELRTRTERIHAFASPESVRQALVHLEQRDEPLVRGLPHMPGQRDARWVHLLTGEPEGTDGPYEADDAGAFLRPENDAEESVSSGPTPPPVTARPAPPAGVPLAAPAGAGASGFAGSATGHAVTAGDTAVVSGPDGERLAALEKRVSELEDLLAQALTRIERLTIDLDDLIGG